MSIHKMILHKVADSRLMHGTSNESIWKSLGKPIFGSGYLSSDKTMMMMLIENILTSR